MPYAVTNLKCNVDSCAHNTDHLCCLQGIDMRGPEAESRFDTCCASFASRNGRFSNVSAHSGEPGNELQIHCTAAQCVHHRKDGSCKADCVRVGTMSHDADRMDETQCLTFAKNKMQNFHNM